MPPTSVNKAANFGIESERRRHQGSRTGASVGQKIKIIKKKTTFFQMSHTSQRNS